MSGVIKTGLAELALRPFTLWPHYPVVLVEYPLHLGVFRNINLCRLVGMARHTKALAIVQAHVIIVDCVNVVILNRNSERHVASR